MEQARENAGWIVALTGGKAWRWRVKALRKGLAHLRTGEARCRATSLLERLNREIRRVSGWILCGQSTTC